MKILLVEDSFEVRDIVKLMLTNYFKSVDIDEVSDRDEALNLYRRRGPYDLVLTDDCPDGLPVVEFAKAIRKEHPTQPIAVFLTLEREIEHVLWEEFRIPSLWMPFEKHEFEKLLQEIFGQRHGVLRPSASHVREASSLFLVIAIGVLIVGTLLPGMGIALVYLGSHGATSLHFFGQSLDSSNVGIAAIFVGATTITVVLSRLMKRLHDIANLPKG